MQKIYPANPQVRDENSICFKPIGFFRTPYHNRQETPRQGVLVPEGKATIKINSIYRKGLAGLDGSEYIIVLYYFDRIRNWSSRIKPPWASRSFGIFSTRTPRRPNPIGLSVIRLDSMDMDRGILYVSGVDAFDNTPVLDIKPYRPAIDCVDITRRE